MYKFLRITRDRFILSFISTVDSDSISECDHDLFFLRNIQYYERLLLNQ